MQHEKRRKRRGITPHCNLNHTLIKPQRDDERHALVFPPIRPRYRELCFPKNKDTFSLSENRSSFLVRPYMTLFPTPFAVSPFLSQSSDRDSKCFFFPFLSPFHFPNSLNGNKTLSPLFSPFRAIPQFVSAPYLRHCCCHNLFFHNDYSSHCLQIHFTYVSFPHNTSFIKVSKNIDSVKYVYLITWLQPRSSLPPHSSVPS